MADYINLNTGEIWVDVKKSWIEKKFRGKAELTQIYPPIFETRNIHRQIAELSSKS